MFLLLETGATVSVKLDKGLVTFFQPQAFSGVTDSLQI